MRRRVLRWFARTSHLDAADARDTASWDHGGGFSLDASIRVEGPDRAGLERLRDELQIYSIGKSTRLMNTIFPPSFLTTL